MPYTMIPPGYRAVLIGQAAAIEDLGNFAPLEESSAEGSLFLARLDFSEPPSAEALDQLEAACAEAGIELWPGYGRVVHTDPESPTAYLAWQKGFAWLPIIIGLLATVALPPLLGSLVWWLMPDSLKNLITGIVNLGIMMLVFFLVSKLIPSFASEKEQISEGKTKRPEELEEARE